MKTAILELFAHNFEVATTLRVYHNSYAYEEYRVCDKSLPSKMLSAQNVEDLRNFIVSLVPEPRVDRFDSFPYKAYFYLRLRFSDESSNIFTVEEAKFADAKHGVTVFTDAFNSTLVGTDLRKKVVANIFSKIADGDADGLLTIVKTLCKTSNKVIKL